MNTDTTKPYLIIKDKSGELVAKRPTMGKPSIKDSKFWTNNGTKPDFELLKVANEEYSNHLQSLPSLHLDASIKGKEGDWVDGEEGYEVSRLIDKDSYKRYWAEAYWKEYSMAEPEYRRITLKAVAEKEEPEPEEFVRRLHRRFDKDNYDEQPQSQEAQREQTADDFINKHMLPMWGSLEMASIEHFIKTGIINGGFRNRMQDMLVDLTNEVTNDFLEPAAPPAEEWVTDNIPTDGTPIIRWHKLWGCPIAVTYEGGKTFQWREVTLSTMWPDDSFTEHWRTLPAPPSNQNKK